MKHKDRGFTRAKPDHRGRNEQQRRPERSTRENLGDLLYGRNAVHEAIRANRRRLWRLLIAEGVREGGPVTELIELATAANVPITRVQRHELDNLTEGANHQGIALETGPYRYVNVDDMLNMAQQRSEMPLLLLLDHLQDPQNVGTLLRTADIVGAHGVVLPDRRAAAITPAVVNASAGAVEHLLIAQVTNLNQTIEELKENNIWIAGLEDDPRAQELDQQQLDLPLALVIGAEGPGLARLVRDRCDFLLKLPMSGHVASLNAATAGSIALYTLWRQRAQRERTADRKGEM
jgi:23S rRNA (guanosine2251-2'-O)-methyltransferase